MAGECTMPYLASVRARFLGIIEALTAGGDQFAGRR